MDTIASKELLAQSIYDDKYVNKTGLGCGCDITQEIGMGNCKTQILDFELLKDIGGIEIDTTQECIKTTRSGEDYTQMTNSINKCLAGNIKLGVEGLSFGWNLNCSLNKKVEQKDIYEYGMTMILQKMYALNIKPALNNQLRNFIPPLVWNEINATTQCESSRVDKSKIKPLFEKYGTHISTKAFYGSLYQYFLFREQNDWESSIEAQLKIGTEASVPIPETGMTVSGGYNTEITNTDKECFKHSYKEIVERKVGGVTGKADLNEWLASCNAENPSTCALLGYALGIDTNNDSGLIPLYELFDPKDARRDAMKGAMEEYIKSASIKLSKYEMVILDAYGKHFNSGETAPSYCYGIDGENDNHRKYFKLGENIFDHVSGSKKGSFYFYYALGYLVEDAVVDMKFTEKGGIDGDWTIRGNHANEGVVGCLKDRYLAIKTKHVKNVKEADRRTTFVTGFGVNVDGKVKAISKGTDTKFNWEKNKDSADWYSSGLIHDSVACIYTKDKLKEF